MKATRVAAVALAWACAAACNQFLDLSTAQCEETSDCAALGSGFEGTTCVAGTCTAPNSPMTPLGPTENSGEGGEGGAPDPAGGCVSTAECMAEHLDEPYVCLEPGTPCVGLKTEECPLVFGDYTDEDAIYFGAFLSVPASAPLSQVTTLNVQLAIDEFNGSVGGIPSGPLGKLRSLVAVVCKNEPELVPAASEHLLSTVGVPAVLAHLPSADIKNLFVDAALPNRTFVMNPGFADNSLTSLSSEGLFWHVIGDIRDVAPVYVPLLERIEGWLAATEPIRVAMIVSKRFAEQSIADTLVPLLRFNGKSAIDNGSLFYTTSVPALPDQPSADYSQINADLLAFRPHVVIAITREEFVYRILPTVESAWPAVAQGQARPFYVVPTALSGNLDLLEYVAEDSPGVTGEDKRRRILGVAPASAEDLTLYNQFLVRFRSAYPRFQSPGGFENFYDAVYLLANAMFAAGSVPGLTGPDIARGMQRVIGGTTVVDVGPTSIADGFTALATGGSILLNGTMGPADFDPGVGARRGNGSVYCIERAADRLSFVYDVLRYDKSGGTLGGELPCIPGF